MRSFVDSVASKMHASYGSTVLDLSQFPQFFFPQNTSQENVIQDRCWFSQIDFFIE